MVSIVTALTIAAVAAALLALLVFVLMRGAQAALRARLEQIDPLTAAKTALEAENQQLRARVVELETLHRADQEKVEWLTGAEQRLRELFDGLAAKALNSNAQQLMERTRAQLEQFSNLLKSDWGTQRQEMRNMVQPLDTELKKLDQHVRTLEQKREGAYHSIQEQIRQVSQQYTVLQETTQSLNQALRSPTARGKWGEVQLRRIAEMAGLAQHVDFSEQVGTAEGGRPDMVVNLPNGAIVPVDAKAPMAAYLDAQEIEDPTLRRAKLKEHAQALRKHVQQLAQKAYWTQFAVAPEFVVLLVPYESGLAAAFGADAELLEYALSNKVVISSPATLLALLKVVAYGWMQLELARNAQAIADQGRQMLERLAPFAEHFNNVGKALNTAVEKYNDAAGSMERRVLPMARKLKELGAGSTEPADPPVIEVAARQLEFGE